MKLKRLITAMILVISVAAAAAIFTGCGDPVTEKEEAIAMLQAASDKASEVTAYSLTSATKDLDGRRRSEGNYKIKGNEYSMTSTTFAEGKDDAESSQYYKDGYLYVNEGDTKHKMTFNFEYLAKGLLSSLLDDDLFDDLSDDEVFSFTGKYKGGKDVFTFDSDEETYIFKLDKKGRLVYMFVRNEVRENEIKINYSSPNITFPGDLDTYEDKNTDLPF